MELLRDKPEFKETIENNIFLVGDIEDILYEIEAEVDYSESKEEIISKVVEEIKDHIKDLEIGGNKVGEVLEDKEVLALDIFNLLSEFDYDLHVQNRREVAEQVIEKMSQFVKENYGISIKEAYLSSLSIL